MEVNVVKHNMLKYTELRKGRVKYNAVRLRTNNRSCGKRENLSSQRKEDREVALACNLLITSTVILEFAVDLSLWILTCNHYNIESFLLV